jgi:hypothetical protein
VLLRAEVQVDTLLATLTSSVLAVFRILKLFLPCFEAAEMETGGILALSCDPGRWPRLYLRITVQRGPGRRGFAGNTGGSGILIPEFS